MKLIGIAGYSGAGKTTLIKRLIPALTDQDITVSTIKHAHHAFDVDKPGKDSFEHRKAGASQVLVSSGARWALMSELRDAPEPGLEELVAQMAPVDLLLIESFKTAPHPKLEIYRESLGKPRLESPNLVGVVSDRPVETELKQFDLNNPEAWARELMDLAVSPKAVDWG